MKRILAKETSDKIVIRIGNYEFVIRKVIKDITTVKGILEYFERGVKE